MTDLTRALVDNFRIPIVAVTRDGEILYTNQAFCEIFGDGREWLRSASAIVGGEKGWLHAFFDGGSEGAGIDVEFENRTYHADSIEIPSGEGVFALSFEDVTRQRESEQAKSDFTSMIVHDLRGPLSGIQGTLEFILSQEDVRLDSMHEDLLKEAMLESERMMGLINELLDFSKIEAGNLEIEDEPTNIGVILKRSVHSMQSVAKRDEMYILSGHPANLPTITGSNEKLTQAIINLISNSLKFTPKKGVISVSAHVDKTREGRSVLYVTITDSGLGIRAEEIDNLFQKYKQTGKKSLRGGSGTGLGLYIVKQIVEAHGGDISIASIEGVGTSMVLRLPLSHTAAA